LNLEGETMTDDERMRRAMTSLWVAISLLHHAVDGRLHHIAVSLAEDHDALSVVFRQLQDGTQDAEGGRDDG